MSKKRKGLPDKKPKERNKKKPIVMTRAKIASLKQTLTLDITYMFCACMMDEFDWTEEDVRAFAVRFDRYQGAVNEHLITMQRIREIVDEVMGLSVTVKLDD